MGEENVGGFLKEAPKPPRTFLEFVFDRTNALRQSQAESLFQSQFSAARVQPPDTTAAGSTGNAGGKPSPGAGDTPSQHRPGSATGHLFGRVYKCRAPPSAGDARGEAPCIK